MPDDWKLAKGQPHCSSCRGEFGDGRPLFSALSERNQDFVREDFCPSCWEQAKEREFFSFWKTYRRAEERRPQVRTEVVLDFFEKLQDGESEHRKELRFVLALYLTRRRALKLVGVSREGGLELIEFRRPRRDETFKVENPQLTEEQIGAATDRLKELFQAEF